MQPKDFTSRMKRDLFGGYRLKKKHLLEIEKELERENLNQKQIQADKQRLQELLEKAEEENRQNQHRISELSTQLSDISLVLQEERDLNIKLSHQLDEVTQKFKTLQVQAENEYEALLQAGSLKDEELRQLEATAQALVHEHQEQLEQQEQIFEQACNQFQQEKMLLETEKQELLINLETVHNAQRKTEKRRKQLETELINCQTVLENEKSECDELNIKLNRLTSEKEAIIKELTSQIEQTSLIQLETRDELEQYKLHVQESKKRLKGVIHCQDEMCVDNSDSVERSELMDKQ